MYVPVCALPEVLQEEYVCNTAVHNVLIYHRSNMKCDHGGSNLFTIWKGIHINEGHVNDDRNLLV